MYNKLSAIGRITKDIETRYTPSGVAVANFTIATNHKIAKDKEESFFIDCVAWDKLAGICSEYLKKGSLVFIEGRLYTETWEYEGKKQYRTKCRIETIKLLDKKEEQPAGNKSTMQDNTEGQANEIEPF